ncbi:MAG: hypothetical protein EVB11_11495 [Winogradskyella sp.]|nr:MAG: hypothetical protein EVB11_11495 [Winogradskyella sp.]
MKFKLIYILSIISISLTAQNFSGEIEYQIKVVPKNDTFNIDSLLNLKNGSVAKYLIKESQYKTTYFKDNVETYSYTYEDISKRMYDNDAENAYITYRDSRKANFNYKGSKIYTDSTDVILGRECFMVEYESDYGKSRTYYSNEVKVDYDSFVGHKVGNWYEKLKEVDGCISIKTITEFDEYYEIQEAVKITPRTIDDSEFSLPSDKIIAASYTALDKRIELKRPSQDKINCYLGKVQDAVNKTNIDKPITSYVSFIVASNGDLKHIEPLERDNQELYKVAMDIIKNCDFEFLPGEIDGTPVSSLTYFPVEFKPKK